MSELKCPTCSAPVEPALRDDEHGSLASGLRYAPPGAVAAGAGDRHVTKMCQYCGRDYYDLASHLSERHGIDMPSVGDRPPAPSEAAFPLEEIERRIESLLANEDLSVTGRGLLEHIRQFAWQLGAVRPTPRAAPPEPSDRAIAAALNVAPERKWVDVQPYGGTLMAELSVDEMRLALRAAYAVDFGASPAAAPQEEGQ